MQKIQSFFLSRILYKKIYDEFGDSIGKLWDVYVTTEDGYPKAIGYKVKKDGEVFNYEFKHIDFWGEENKITVKIKDANEIIPRTYSYLLSKHLLDKQIVDINGKKLVRVHDLRMAHMNGELRVVAVDTGMVAFSRRFNSEKLIKALYKMLHKKPSDSLIIWDNVESLEMVNENLKLSVPYKKLSKLHPADLADILEEMDTSNRNRVFESLEQNLAAETLEEIEPEVQADILETISESKALEILEEVPNDEIADMLEELDEKTKEKILMHLEKGDAEEVRSLMEYGDETVGSIMNKDFIAFNVNITAGETIDLLRELKPDDEVAYYIYIIDEEEKLQGVISLRNLVVSHPETKLKELMDTNVIKAEDDEKIDDAIETAAKYNLLSLPITDKRDRLCGIVIMSDLVDEVLLPAWKRKFRKAV